MTAPADTQISFEADIKPLFRERDQRSMKFVFDLWSYEDVKEHADDIVDNLRSGDMPCDGTWPTEQVDLFQAWMDADFPA